MAASCLVLKEKVELKTEHAIQAQMVSRGITTLFNLGPRFVWVVNATHRPLYPRERDKVSVVQEAAWSPGPVWTDAEILFLTGIRYCYILVIHHIRASSRGLSVVQKLRVLLVLKE